MEVRDLKRVELVNKISIRYYLVSINGKYYIIDYADINNFKDYFIGFFPERIRSYDIYDVSKDYKKFLSNGKFKFFSIKTFTVFFILYLINIMIFPQKLNLAFLTKSTFILNNIILFYFLSLLTIIAILILLKLKNTKLDLSRYKKSELIYMNYKKNNPFKVFLSILVGYVVLWCMALWGSNFSNLILFGFICANSLFFIKFIEFQPSLNGKNYVITGWKCRVSD